MNTNPMPTGLSRKERDRANFLARQAERNGKRVERERQERALRRANSLHRMARFVDETGCDDLSDVSDEQ